MFVSAFFSEANSNSLAAAFLFFLRGLILVRLGLRLAAQLDGITGWLLLLCARALKFILVDLVDHLHESLLHVDVASRARLKVLHVIVRCQLLSFLSRDRTFICKIALVANEKSRDISFAVLVDGHDPPSHGLESLRLGQIEADHHALRLLVESHCQRFEAFLTCRIPNLQVVARIGR